MLKIKNEKKSYQSRSKNVFNKVSEDNLKVNIQKSRKEFRVDHNGYFLWGSDSKSKKI